MAIAREILLATKNKNVHRLLEALWIFPFGAYPKSPKAIVTKMNAFPVES